MGHDTLGNKIKAGNFQGLFQKNKIKAWKPSLPEYFLYRTSPGLFFFVWVFWFIGFFFQKELIEGTTKKIKGSITSTSHASALKGSYLWPVTVSPGRYTKEILAQEAACR